LGTKFFVSDCEGPISTNDNAFELSGHFIDDGEKFFEIVSKYDDILADEVKRPGYNAGGTLKLILPFLKAYGATNQNIKDFSEENVLLIPGAAETLHFVCSIMPSFIVSTSYQQYINAICDLTDFPFENTYSTKLNIEKYPLTFEEKDKLLELKNRILENSDFKNLDEIFWKEIPNLEIGRIIDDVNPVGGEGKKEALEDIINKLKSQPSDMIYVGDSITDVQPLRFAREEGGMAVSFNGNEYAMEEAEIAVIADNTLLVSITADLFNKSGTEEVLEFTKSFAKDPQFALQSFPVDPQLILKVQDIVDGDVGGHLKMEPITKGNRERLKKESLQLRKKIRGEAIGGLG
jgi:energy-converting hydrogenase A subunit R